MFGFWFLVFVLLTGVGCTSKPGKELEDRRTKLQKIAEDYEFEAIYLGYPTFYLLKFEGHEYLSRGSNSNILHSITCPGRHDDE